MSGVDLRFDLPAALGDLENARRAAIDRLNSEHDELAAKLRTVARVHTEGEPSISSADAVVFTEHEITCDARELTIGFPNTGVNEWIRLSKPLPAGKYRLLVLITKVPT